MSLAATIPDRHFNCLGDGNSASISTYVEARPRHSLSDAPIPSPAESPSARCERLSDTILAEIAAGARSLTAITAAHRVPYVDFTRWLLRPETQQSLADLSSAVASAARLAATSALPDVVRALKPALAQIQPPVIQASPHTGADPLPAQIFTLRRHRTAIAAASLIYRIARFTCPSQHPPTPPPSTSPKGEVAAKRPVGTPAFPSASSTSSLRPALFALPRLDLPDLDRPQAHSTRDPAPRQPVPPAAATSCTDPALDVPPETIEQAVQALVSVLDLNAEQTAELRADPASWVRTHAHDADLLLIDARSDPPDAADDG